MESWENYLERIKKPADASAIITLRGNHCMHKGAWTATHEEEVKISQILLDPSSTSSQELLYNGKPYGIRRSEAGIIVAQAEDEGVILQKSKTCIIGAHYQGQYDNADEVFGFVHDIVNDFSSVNY
ncbi:hypothetical protein M9Y10_014785 [Tritrichomonas musculus]|uniref:Profilin n=1 Tax=Tritrichomonas musculus TaxID=1915356 RepID=A0ABR2L0G2_9EUKA